MQEIVNWGGTALTDCLSLVTPRGSRYDRPVTVRENPDFMTEAVRIAAVAELYRCDPVPVE